MQKNDALRVDVVKHQHKEAKLSTFIAEQRPACIAAGGTVSVLARSIESPVMRALAALHAAGQLTELSLKIIVLETNPTIGRSSLGAETLALAGADLRSISDRRILDAHEQMILAPTVCWIGDCMRRDPSNRDAFETMTTSHRTATMYAQSSFERLWTIAIPFAVLSTSISSAHPVAPVVTDAPPPQASEGDPAATHTFSRH